jgi:hypothetical protein
MLTGVSNVRKIVVYELLSLDGVAEDPDEFITDWDDAMDANLAVVIATQDAVILGRRSYDEWARFWPASRSSIRDLHQRGREVRRDLCTARSGVGQRDRRRRRPGRIRARPEGTGPATTSASTPVSRSPRYACRGRRR